MAEPDLSEFLTASRPKKPTCGVGIALPEMSKDDQQKLTAAINAGVGIITNTAVQKWLQARGHSINSTQITAHRHGTCSCHVR